MNEDRGDQRQKIWVNKTADSALLESFRLGSEVRQAELRVTNPLNVEIQKDRLDQESISLFVSFDDTDDFAIAWCKHRKLQKYLGGPVGNEWASPDCPYQ